MVIRIIILFLIFTNVAYSECNIFYDKAEKKNLKLINIEIENNKSFFKKAARFYIAVNSNKNSDRFKKNPEYKKKYQKKTKAKITFELKNGTKCILKAKLRAHGDGQDHIDLVNGITISSYRIKLNEGNFNNITRFILFRPKSRNFDNEIFISTILNQLGFLSPRTFKVKVKIDSVISDYIFQENIKKEFLEYNKKIEGPLLEAKEDFYNFNKLSLARVSNPEWIKNINQNYIISMNSLKNYNTHRFYGYGFRLKSIDYLKNSGKEINQNYDGLAIDEIVRFDKKNLEHSEFEAIGTYQALMYALDASHGLSYDDARFYYDPIYNKLEPIYYDGNSNILSAINYDRYEGKYRNNLPNWKILKDNVLDFKQYLNYSSQHNLHNQVVTQLAKENANNALLKIEKIDLNNLLTELKNNGMEDIKKEQLFYLINYIKSRLENISNSKIKEELKLEGNQYEKYSKQMKIKNKLDLYFYNNLFLKNNELNVSFDKCDHKIDNCVKKNFNNKQLTKLIEQNELTIFRTKEEYKNGSTKKQLLEVESEFNQKEYFNNFKIIKNDNVSIKFDKQKKEIYIDYIDFNGRVIIYNSNIDSWKIYMDNKIIDQGLINTKTYLSNKKLTGCLTIMDSIVNNIEIYANEFFCEDTVNFIRSTGQIKNIEINKSLSDGLDMDFSHISILNLNISNSGNDCADFSYGTYKIDKANIKFCGDKAISVGEKSEMDIQNLYSEESTIGVASKDGSNTKINKLLLNNTKTCLSAYKKKQEFQGGKITVNNFSCNNFSNKTYLDDISSIKIQIEKL